jgi:hypothetical protein
MCLSEAHPRPTTVLIDELHASGLHKLILQEAARGNF